MGAEREDELVSLQFHEEFPTTGFLKVGAPGFVVLVVRFSDCRAEGGGSTVFI